MYQIIKEEIHDPIQKITIKDLPEGSNSIYICQKGRTSQSLLVHHNKAYFWTGFYLYSQQSYKMRKRTNYATFKEAINSRFEKGYKVFVLFNKTEFKEAINPKT